MAELQVRGLKELQALLDTLPAKIERNILRSALRAGVQPIKAAAIAAAPVGPPSARGAKRYGLYAGALRDSIRVTTRSKGGRVSASVKAGGKIKGANVWYAHIIEYTGAVAHIIRSKIGGSLVFGGRFYRNVNHPGMKARPFMRPALDNQAQSAVIASGDYIKQRLATKEGLDTSHITVEGDE